MPNCIKGGWCNLAILRNHYFAFGFTKFLFLIIKNKKEKMKQLCVSINSIFSLFVKLNIPVFRHTHTHKQTNKQKKKGIKSLLVPTFLGDFHFSP